MVWMGEPPDEQKLDDPAPEKLMADGLQPPWRAVTGSGQGRLNRQKSKQERLRLSRINFFPSEDRQPVEQAAQRGCPLEVFKTSLGEALIRLV